MASRDAPTLSSHIPEGLSFGWREAVGKAGTAVRRSHHCSYTFHSDSTPAMTISFRSRETNCCWDQECKIVFIFFYFFQNKYKCNLLHLKIWKENLFSTMYCILYLVLYSVSLKSWRNTYSVIKMFFYIWLIFLKEGFKSSISIRTCSQGWNYVLFSFWDSIKWD